jgi:hypothetical protein
MVSNNNKSQEWWHMPVVPDIEEGGLGKRISCVQELEGSLSNIM